jgi:hypothetical protein
MFGKTVLTTSKLSNNVLSKGSNALAKAGNTVSSSNLRSSQKAFVPISTTAEPTHNSSSTSNVSVNTSQESIKVQLSREYLLNASANNITGAKLILFMFCDLVRSFFSFFFFLIFSELRRGAAVQQRGEVEDS